MTTNYYHFSFHKNFIDNLTEEQKIKIKCICFYNNTTIEHVFNNYSINMIRRIIDCAESDYGAYKLIKLIQVNRIILFLKGKLTFIFYFIFYLQHNGITFIS